MFSMRKFILIFIISVFSFSGCISFEKLKIGSMRAYKSVNYFKDDELASKVGRVLVLPVKNISGIEFDESGVYNSLFLSLLHKKYFEVLKYQSFPENMISELQNSFKPEASNNSMSNILKVFGEKYKIDAILFSEISVYKSYKPLVLGYKHFLYSTNSAQVAWSVDDVFDMGDKNVNALSKNWYFKKYEEDRNPSMKSDIMEISMNNFVEFSFSVLLETWQNKK